MASQAQSPYESSADFAKYAMKLREQAMMKVEPQVFVPTSSRTSFAPVFGHVPPSDQR